MVSTACSNSTRFATQVREALPWLNSRLEPSEFRRYAAVLVCREMASEAPAVFNVHVKAFLDGIWGGLRDPKLHVREASVQALEVGSGFDAAPLLEIAEQVQLQQPATAKHVAAAAPAARAVIVSFTSAFCVAMLQLFGHSKLWDHCS